MDQGGVRTPTFRFQQKHYFQPLELAERWLAPEVLLDNEQISLKSQIWSLGVLFYEVVTHGDLPYGDLTELDDEELVQQIAGGVLNLASAKYFSSVKL